MKTENLVILSILIFAVAMTIAIAAYNIHINALIKDMTNAGANPILASCAMHDTYGRNPSCIVLTAQRYE